MANQRQRWYPNLSGESPRVADAIRLLWDAVYNLSGQNNTSVSVENSLNVNGIVTANNSDNPASNELLSKKSADNLYSASSISKALSSSGSNPLPLSGLTGYPNCSIQTGIALSRPSSGSIDGQLYYETDTKKIYVWNKSASTWTYILDTDPGSGTGVHSSLTNLDYASAGHTGFQAALGYTAEDSANKSTSTSLGTSNTLYPTQNAVKSYADAKVADSISDGVTTIAPSENAVFDALALKANIASPTFTGTATTPAIKITTGAGVGKILTSDADGDATWETASGSGWKYPMDFRPTLESGVPASTTAQTAKTTLYLTPYCGNQIALYDGSSAWTIYTSAEISISLAGLTASTPYDIWCYANSGTPTLELLAWTDATTRATALARQDGVYVKSGATTRRYIGTIYINASGGQTDDTPGGSDLEAKRYVWSYYNRINREFSCYPSTASWSYTTNTFRPCNNTTNGTRVSFVIGVQEDSIIANFWQWAGTGSSSGYARSGLSSDSIVACDMMNMEGNATNQRHTLTCNKVQSFIGYHYIQAMEIGDSYITYYGGDYFKLNGIIRG